MDRKFWQHKTSGEIFAVEIEDGLAVNVS